MRSSVIDSAREGGVDLSRAKAMTPLTEGVDSAREGGVDLSPLCTSAM